MRLGRCIGSTLRGVSIIGMDRHRARGLADIQVRVALAGCFLAILIATYGFAVTSVMSTISSYRPFPYFGDRQPHPATSGSSESREFAITDAYGRAEARQFGGQRVADRMLERTTTETSLSNSVSYASLTDPNWGGWVADTVAKPYWVNGAFGYFYAQYVCATCNPLGSWVGVGGFNGTNIVQSGFDEKLHRAWYQLSPNKAVYLKIYPAAGDELYVDVHLDHKTYLWYVFFDDLTSGKYFLNEFSFNPDENSAEWIVELPSGTTVPKSNSVLFPNSHWADQYLTNQAVNSSESVPTSITLVADGCGKITPSALTGGTRFQDTVSGC
jgi:Peptidase A4 family